MFSVVVFPLKLFSRRNCGCMASSSFTSENRDLAENAISEDLTFEGLCCGGGGVYVGKEGKGGRQGKAVVQTSLISSSRS